MDKAALAKIIRNRARDMIDSPPHDGPDRQAALDTAELLCVLARVLNGRPIEQAFGAPGDWGYDTPIGKALVHPRETAHYGDPCRYCGTPHDDVAPGPCPARVS